MLLTIFSGTELLFFMLGVVTTLCIIGIVKLYKMYQLDWKSWITLILGIFLAVFSAAWAISSVLEGEPRAASMGMVFFGIPGIIILLLGRRFIVKCDLKSE
jgi:hypothetical protein